MKSAHTDTRLGSSVARRLLAMPCARKFAMANTSCKCSDKELIEMPEAPEQLSSMVRREPSRATVPLREKASDLTVLGRRHNVAMSFLVTRKSAVPYRTIIPTLAASTSNVQLSTVVRPSLEQRSQRPTQHASIGLTNLGMRQHQSIGQQRQDTRAPPQQRAIHPSSTRHTARTFSDQNAKGPTSASTRDSSTFELHGNNAQITTGVLNSPP